MQFSVIAVFVIVFLLVLVSVSLGLKFFESRRKKHVTGMLKTVAGTPVITETRILRDEVDPVGSPVDQLLKKFNVAVTVKAQIQQSGLEWTPTRLVNTMGLAALAGVVLGMLFPFLLNRFLTCLTLGVAAGSIPYLAVLSKRKKRLARFEEQLPEALDFLARSMRAGHAFTISMEMLGDELEEPMGQEFRTLFNEQNLGAPLEVALNNFVQRAPLLDVRFFASAVLLQRQTGGNLGEILTRLSYIIRERFRLKGQVRAASAHGRLTARILTLLPIATMLGLLLVAPGYLQGMANDPDGKVIILGAIVAQVLGNYFIRRIINIKV